MPNTLAVVGLVRFWNSWQWTIQFADGINDCSTPTVANMSTHCTCAHLRPLFRLSWAILLTARVLPLCGILVLDVIAVYFSLSDQADGVRCVPDRDWIGSDECKRGKIFCIKGVVSWLHSDLGGV